MTSNYKDELVPNEKTSFASSIAVFEFSNKEHLIAGYYDGKVIIFNCQTLLQVEMATQLNVFSSVKNIIIIDKLAFIGDDKKKLTKIDLTNFFKKSLSYSVSSNFDMTFDTDKKNRFLYFAMPCCNRLGSRLSLKRQRVYPYKPLPDSIYSLASDDEFLKVFLTSGNKGNLSVFETRTGVLKKKLKTPDSKDISCLLIRPKKYCAVLGTLGNTLFVLCLKKYNIRKQISISHGLYSFHLKNSILVLGHSTNKMSILDLEREKDYSHKTDSNNINK